MGGIPFMLFRTYKPASPPEPELTRLWRHQSVLLVNYRLRYASSELFAILSNRYADPESVHTGSTLSNIYVYIELAVVWD